MTIIKKCCPDFFMVKEIEINNKSETIILNEQCEPYTKDKIRELISCCKSHLKISDKNLKSLIDEYDRQFMERMREPAPKQKNKESEKGYIYILKSKLGHKIGRSKGKTRPQKLTKILLPVKVEIEFFIKVDDYINAEKELHEIFENALIRGEWFKLSYDQIEYIKCFLQERAA